MKFFSGPSISLIVCVYHKNNLQYFPFQHREVSITCKHKSTIAEIFLSPLQLIVAGACNFLGRKHSYRSCVTNICRRKISQYKQSKGFVLELFSIRDINAIIAGAVRDFIMKIIDE